MTQEHPQSTRPARREDRQEAPALPSEATRRRLEAAGPTESTISQQISEDERMTRLRAANCS